MQSHVSQPRFVASVVVILTLWAPGRLQGWQKRQAPNTLRNVSLEFRAGWGEASMRGEFTANELPSVDEVLADPAASLWLKSALRSALSRDPVDAANDSEILARLLRLRCHRLLGKAQRSVAESG
jgi:hypothetical protein